MMGQNNKFVEDCLKSTAHSCIGADHTKPRIDNGIFYYSAGGDDTADQTMGDPIAGQGLAVGDVVTYYASTRKHI